MKNKLLAIKAIEKLREGITKKNKAQLLEAYEMVEDESFSWDGMDGLFEEWNQLVEQVNEILYS